MKHRYNLSAELSDITPGTDPLPGLAARVHEALTASKLDMGTLEGVAFHATANTSTPFTRDSPGPLILTVDIDVSTGRWTLPELVAEFASALNQACTAHTTIDSVTGITTRPDTTPTQEDQ